MILVPISTEPTEMGFHSPHRKITTLSWFVVGLILTVVGNILVYCGSADVANVNPVWKAFITNVGGVLIATGLISFFWELVAKRSFLAEVFSVARLSEDIRRSGLCRLTTNFQHEIEWQDLLGTAKRIDVFFVYARTWRNTNLSLLQAFAERSGTQMTLILPNPEDPDVCKELARRIGTIPETIKERIEESIDSFKKMFDKKQGAKGALAIWITDKTPVFSFYRIDNKYIIATYRHRPDRGDIPTFMTDRRGDLADFIDREFAALTDETALGKKIYPPPRGQTETD